MYVLEVGAPEDTVAAAQAPETTVKTCPFDPGGIKLTVPVPFPARRLFAVNVLLPVPPLDAVTVPVRPVVTSTCPDELTLLASWLRLNACVILGSCLSYTAPVRAKVC